MWKKQNTAWGGTRTKALAQIGLFVDEDFGRYHISKRHKHLQDILVPKLLWQVVDEEVGSFRPWMEEKLGIQDLKDVQFYVP